MSERAGNPEKADLPGAEVEFYAGYRSEETPRAVVLGGVRVEVAEVLERKRRRPAPGEAADQVEEYRCRLADGREIVVERRPDGCRVRPA
jgi:hypothetical protein